MVRGPRAVRSAGHPKSLYHPYWSLLHERRPLAGLAEFMAAGSGELQAQAGRGGIGFRGDSSRESPAVEAVRVRQIAVIAEPAPANNCPGVMRYVCVSGPVRRVG